MENWIQIKSNIQSEIEAISKALEKIEISEPNGSFEVRTEELCSSDTKNIKLKKKIKAHFSTFEADVVYTVALKECAVYSAINAAFLKAKSSKKGKREYSKYNNEESGFLYVGSSQSKRLVSRMRNHLGIGALKEYSMHIKAWLPEYLDCTIVIRVFQTNIPDKNFKSVKMLELVEQGLWDFNKPLFGKRSGLL